MAKAASSAAPTRVLTPVKLTSETERIRFVLRARIREARVSQIDLARTIDRELQHEAASRPIGSTSSEPDHMTRAKLLYWLTTADLTADGLQFVRLVERHGIHNSATSTYARRILREDELDRRGDSQWWIDEFSNMDRYNRAIEVIVAALSLHQFVIERGVAAIADDPASARAIRPLAFALCRVGSGSMGYASEALPTIARLGSVISEHVAEFMADSPLGLWLGRAADGALRRQETGGTVGRSDQLVNDYTEAARQLRNQVSASIPAACTGHLRLLRRVAMNSRDDASVGAANQLLTIAADSSLSARWRRFALWAACEHAVRFDDEFRTQFVSAVHAAHGDAILSDVAAMLSAEIIGMIAGPNPAGGEHEDFDAFLHNSRDTESGVFRWPLESFPATNEVLESYTARNFKIGNDDGLVYNNPNVEDLGIDIRLRFLDALHEAIVHPGVVRTQAAIDMFYAAGEDVTGAVVSTISSILLDPRVLDDWDSHHPGVLETCVEVLGGMRHQSALKTLKVLSDRRYGQFIHARAIWALGDILSVRSRNSRVTPMRDEEIFNLIRAALDETSIAVRRAALHTIAVAKLHDRFIGEIEQLTAVNNELHKWATWCYESRNDIDFINRAPYEM